MQLPFICRQPLLLLLASLLPALFLASDSLSRPSTFAERPDVQAFIRQLVVRDHFQAHGLYALFNQVHPLPVAPHHMNHPLEVKPWPVYRDTLVTEARISGGVDFWAENADTLAEAHRIYNVPPEVIIAIIGIETGYGRNTGAYRLLDTLSTLAFNYPRRRDFFQRQLEQYLLMTREEQLDPLAISGSYAGAMGLPQFLPGTFRRYAVDFDHDGHRDIWHDPADAIGSVANYFRHMGWNALEPVAVPARISHHEWIDPLVAAGLEGNYPLATWRSMGVTPATPLPDTTQARLLVLDDGRQGKEYWLLLPNFDVIRHYNKSSYYAMAVHHLAQAVLQRHQQAAP